MQGSRELRCTAFLYLGGEIMLTHKGTQPIQTPRLLLRRALPEDAEAMLANWASDPEVTRFLTWPPHASLAVTRAVIAGWLEGYREENFYQWMIVLCELGEPIGSISVVSRSDTTESAEIGYCIGRRWWHRGIMTEALEAVIDFLFDEVGVNRVEAKHDPKNPHSGAVMRKCGMKYEGTTRASARNNQGLCDTAHYAILRAERPREHFMADFVPKDDSDLVQELYRRHDEDGRLSAPAARVELLTNLRVIEEEVPPGAKLLDVGAGTGAYSLYLAEQGYAVTALELSERNLEVLRSKVTKDVPVQIEAGNALDLSRYPDASFDAVLLMGPLYHLHAVEDRLRAIAEARRVCRPGGKLFFAFISADPVILSMQQAHPEYLLEGDYDKESFRLDDYPFVFHTVGESRALLARGGVCIRREVASDGVSELLKDLINGLDSESYRQYLRYHFYLSEKPECLGMSHHLLFVGE